MSLILVDGFDDGLHDLKWSRSSAMTVASGRNGNCLNPGNQSVFKIVPAAMEHATFILGCAFQITSFSGWVGTPDVFQFRSDANATQHVTVRISNTGAMTITRAGTVLATSTVALALGQWYYLELKATLHDTTGAIELRLNGVTVASVTNVDTKNAGTKTVFDTVQISIATGGNGMRIDDLYLLNGAGSRLNDFLGDVAIETLFPSGNGATSQFVGSDGNSTDNYALVDEATPSATDYVGGATVGDTDTYTFGDLLRTGGTVHGVVATAYAANSDAGARGLALVARPGSTDRPGSGQALTTTYTPYREVWEQNPDTSTDWTVAAVNAAEFGVKVAS